MTTVGTGTGTLPDKTALRAMVRGAYDLQKVRIHAGNRLAAAHRVKLGIEPGENEEEASPEAKALLAKLRESHKRITDAIVGNPRPRGFKGDDLISTYAQFALVSVYVGLVEQEERLFKDLEAELRNFPVWTEFLVKVRGCGPAMGAVIVSEIEISISKYPSSLFRYAGLDVGGDGQGRSKRAEHLVDVAYTNAKGEAATRKSVTFNPFLKTKLVGVLAECLLRASNPVYRPIYDGYKHRLEQHPGHVEKTKGHRHRMALRYMMKQFLKDLYKAWRPLEGLVVHPPYEEAKLGLTHGPEGSGPGPVHRPSSPGFDAASGGAENAEKGAAG